MNDLNMSRSGVSQEPSKLLQGIVVTKESFKVRPVGQEEEKLFPKGSRGQIANVDDDGIAVVQLNHDVNGGSHMPIIEIPSDYLDPV